MRIMRYKLILVNDATGKKEDSKLKGADMLSAHEVKRILKHAAPLLAKGYHYEKVRIQ